MPTVQWDLGFMTDLFLANQCISEETNYAQLFSIFSMLYSTVNSEYKYHTNLTKADRDAFTVNLTHKI